MKIAGINHQIEQLKIEEENNMMFFKKFQTDKRNLKLKEQPLTDPSLKSPSVQSPIVLSPRVAYEGSRFRESDLLSRVANPQDYASKVEIKTRVSLSRSVSPHSVKPGS
jgi:hypothetical protein